MHAFPDTVEPLNKDTFGTRRFVFCRELGCPLLEVIFHRLCIREYTFSLSFVGRFVLFQSVQVSLYMHIGVALGLAGWCPALAGPMLLKNYAF